MLLLKATHQFDFKGSGNTVILPLPGEDITIQHRQCRPQEREPKKLRR
jgi:hypothetical protein